MKNLYIGALIGGIIGFCVGIGSLILMNFPQLLTYLFLGRVYEMILPPGELGETLGWLYPVFSTLAGVLYGRGVASLIKKLQK